MKKSLVLVAVLATSIASAALPNPKVCTVTVGATDATLTWDAVPGATAYRVWQYGGAYPCPGGTYGQTYCWWGEGPNPTEPWKYMSGLKPNTLYIRYVSTEPNGVAYSAKCRFRTLALPT